MTYVRASVDGFLIAERSLQPYTDNVIEAYKSAIEDINRQLEKSYAKLAGKDKTKYWEYLSENNRYEAIKTEITRIYREASREAGRQIESGLGVAMTENYGRQLYLSAWVAPEISAVVIDPNVVKYAVTGNVTYWNKITRSVRKRIADQVNYTPRTGTLSSLLNKNYTEQLDDILQAIQSGYISGLNYRAQARNIRQIIGTAGADGATGSIASALRIARTEGTRVMNAGALTSAYEAQAQGADMVKRWDATLDGKTRESHGRLDGTIKFLYQNFATDNGSGAAPGQMSDVSDNANCRCTLNIMPQGTETTLRRAVDPVTGKSDIIGYKTYADWIKAA